MTPTIDALRLDSSSWRPVEEGPAPPFRVWTTPDGDAVSLHFFNSAPDLPHCSTSDQLRDYFVAVTKGSGACIVGCCVVAVAGHPSVQLLLKVRQKPSGMMYQGALTVPFRDFSFVVKVQCFERGMTGVREAVLLAKRASGGESPRLDEGGPIFRDWDPDSPSFDSEFPTHPVSRARRLLNEVANSARLDEAVRQQPRFALPTT